MQVHTHAQVHTHTHVNVHTHTHVNVHIHTTTTAPVTKSGDSMLVLSVREGKLDIIKYFVSEQGVDVNGEFTSPIIQAHTHTHTLHTNSYKPIHIRVSVMHTLTTAPVTTVGDTLLGLAVHESQFDTIKYLVTECSVSVSGEQSVYVSPAVHGVCK